MRVTLWQVISRNFQDSDGPVGVSDFQASWFVKWELWNYQIGVILVIGWWPVGCSMFEDMWRHVKTCAHYEDMRRHVKTCEDMWRQQVRNLSMQGRVAHHFCLELEMWSRSLIWLWSINWGDIIKFCSSTLTPKYLLSFGLHCGSLWQKDPTKYPTKYCNYTGQL